MKKSLRLLTLCLALLVAFGCSGEKKDADVAETTEAPAAEAPVADASGTSAEPDYGSVQHILFGSSDVKYTVLSQGTFGAP